MTIDEALEKVEVGQSIEQTIWTHNPGGDIEPEEGVEYQVKLVVTKGENGACSIKQHRLAKRQR